MNKKILIQQIAKKYGLLEKEVEDAVNHQFRYTRSVIRAGKFDAVRLPYFGVFRVNPERLKYLTKNKDKNKE